MREKRTKAPKKKMRRRGGLSGSIGAALVVLAFAALSAFGGDSLLDRILPALTPAPTLAEQTQAPTDEPVPTPIPAATASPATTHPLPIPAPLLVSETITVWIPQSGSRYHLTSTCSGMQNPTAVSLQEAKEQGFTPCQRCNPPE